MAVARQWDTRAMLNRAMLAGPVVGGTLGVTVVVVTQLVCLAFDNEGWNVLAAVVVYGYIAFLMGAVIGIIEALAAVGLVLLLVRSDNLRVARAVGAGGTVVVPALLAACTYPLPIVAGLWGLAALAAAVTMPWVTRSPA